LKPLLYHKIGLSEGILVFISVIFLLALLIYAFPIYSLRVIEATRGSELILTPIHLGDRISIEYIHSIYKVKQTEVFTIAPGSLFTLEKVTFGSLPAALYYNPDPPQRLVFEDNAWILNGNGKHYSNLKYRVSPGTGHVLKIKNRKINLSNGLIQVELEKQSRLISILAPIFDKTY